MNKYIAILRIGWLSTIEYRTDFLISVIGWGTRILIAFFLWFAVIQARGGQNIASYSFQGIIQYFLIIQIISSFIFSRVGFDMTRDISKGDFANFLIKPVNYVILRMVHEISENAFRTLLGVGIFGTILFFFFGGIPFYFAKIPVAIISILLSYLINFFMVGIISLSSFWFTNTSRLLFIYFGILTILSGTLFPIDLFPEKFFEISRYLPFAYIFFFPTKLIQSGELNLSSLEILIYQFFFAAILGILMTIFYKKGVKHFEAVGR